MKVLLAGAGVSLASGLLLGAAMQPHLDAVEGRPVGPQLFANASGPRADGPFELGGMAASYRGEIPDYVLGSDWKRSLNPPAERARGPVPGDGVNEAETVEPTTTASTRMAYGGPPRAYVYPSLGGTPQWVADVSAEDAEDPEEPADRG